MTVGSESERGLETGRGLLPRIALVAQAIAVVEEGLHIDGVELLLLSLELEVALDLRQVEIEPIVLGRHVDAVEIAEPLRVDERRDGAAGDADRPSLDARPRGAEGGVPDDVDAALDEARAIAVTEEPIAGVRLPPASTCWRRARGVEMLAS